MGAKRPKSLYIYLLLFPLISSVSPLTTLFLFACFFLFFLLCLSNFLKFSKIFNFLIRMEEISNFGKMRRKYSKKMFNVKCFGSLISRLTYWVPSNLWDPYPFVQRTKFFLYLNFACLGVCLFGCLYPINVKMIESIGPKFCVGPHVFPGKVYE